MPYGSINGVKDNLPKLRKYIKKEDAPNFDPVLDIGEQTVTRVLTEISNQIDAALSQKYPVPFSEAPSLVTGIANDLAAFKIARSYMTTISAEENLTLNAMRKDAKELLSALASGESVLPGGTNKAASSIEQQLQDLNVNGSEEIFDLEDVESWQAKA